MFWFRQCAALLIVALFASSCSVAASTSIEPIAAAVPIADAADDLIDAGDLVDVVDAVELNELAAWDAMLIERYERAGGSGGSMYNFSTVAGGYCLDLVTADEADLFFPDNPNLGRAARDLDDADCARHGATFMGNGPSGAATWDEILELRFSRTVSFGDFGQFERAATDLCESGEFPSAMNVTGLSSSAELEIYGLHQSGECDFLAENDGPAVSQPLAPTPIAVPEPAAPPAASTVTTNEPAPALSEQIFFYSGDDADAISVLDLTTGATATVVSSIDEERIDTGASVSPNGQQLAYTRNYQMYLADRDGLNERLISRGDTVTRHPVWSPDGSAIVYTETIGSREVYDLGLESVLEREEGCSVEQNRLVLASAAAATFAPLTEFERMNQPNAAGTAPPEQTLWTTDGHLAYVAVEDCGIPFLSRTINITNGAIDSFIELTDGLTPIVSLSPATGRIAVAGIDGVPADYPLRQPFTANRSLYLEDETTGELELVPDVIGPAIHLDWSPDGQWLAFVTYADPGTRWPNNGDEHVLHVVSADGTDVRTLTSVSDPLVDVMARWAPDSSSLVYSHDSSDLQDEMVIVDLDGNHRPIGVGVPIAWRAGQPQLAPPAPPAPDDPSPSEPGTDSAATIAAGEREGKIFFHSGPDGDRISVIDGTTGESEVVVEQVDAERAGNGVAVAPSGDLLAYARDGRIYLAYANGDNEQQVSSGKHHARHPVWSPDGLRLVFSEQRDNPRTEPITIGELADGIGPCAQTQSRLALVNVDAGSTNALTAFESLAGYTSIFTAPAGPAVWQPNGRLTYFETEDCSNDHRIRVVDLDTQERLTLHELPERADPIFSVSPVDGRLAIAGIDGLPDGVTAWHALDLNRGLYLENRASNELVAVPGVAGPVVDVNWSPDGEWVTFLAVRDWETGPYAHFKHVLHVISADGTDVRTLTSTIAPLTDMTVRWSPGSDELVYSHDIGESEDQMVIVDLDGNSRVIGSGMPIAWR